MTAQKKLFISRIIIGILAFLVFLRIVSGILLGILPNNTNNYFLLLSNTIVNKLLFLLLPLSAIAVYIYLRKRVFVKILLLAFLLVCNFIPNDNLAMIGSIIQFRSSDPNQIKIDTLELINMYDVNTYLSNSKKRYPFNNALPMMNLPSSINNINLSSIYILDGLIILEKYGFPDDFHGYIIIDNQSINYEYNINELAIMDCNEIQDDIFWCKGNLNDLDIGLPKID